MYPPNTQQQQNMLADGIRPIGDGLLEVAAERLQGLLVQEDINEIYDVEQTPFARGKFAAVRRAIHKKSGVHYAAKFLRRRRRAQCTLKEIGHEIAILMLCADSKHIVKLNSVHETRSETALLLELATGGELQAILDEEGALTEAQAQICMREILKALQYMHKKCVAHLDLKPQNILLCGDKVEDGLKLCDFGISRIVEEGGKVREILGTPDYVAPEVLQYEPLSLKTDIWSVGVLAYVLLTGMSPFGGDTKQETFLNISKCALTFPDELFEDISPMAIDFIKCALRVKPNDRMTASECLEHRWLNEDQPLRLVTPINHSLNDCNDFFDKTHKSPSPMMTYSNSDLMTVHSKFIVEPVETTAINDTTSTTRTNKCDNDNLANKENILVKSGSNKLHAHTQHVTVVQTVSLTTSPSSSAATQPSINISTSSLPQSTLSSNGIYLLDEIINEELNLPPSTIPPPSQQPSIIITNNNNNNNNNSSIGDICDNPSIIKHQPSPHSLFPDAPTTPKVCRKSTPDSPPSVKALVKKFQLDNGDLNGVGVKITNIGAAGCGSSSSSSTSSSCSSNNTNGTTKTTSTVNGSCCITTISNNGDAIITTEDDYCTTSRCSVVTCTLCCESGSSAGNSGCCRHINGNTGRKPLVIDQGIIC